MCPAGLITIWITFRLPRIVDLPLHRAPGTTFFVVAGDIGANRTGSNRCAGRRPRHRARFRADGRNGPGVLHAATAIAAVAGRTRDAMHARVVNPEAVSVIAVGEVCAAARWARATLSHVVADRSCRRGTVATCAAMHLAAHGVLPGTARVTAAVRYAWRFCIGERTQRSDNRAQRPMLRSRQPVHLRLSCPKTCLKFTVRAAMNLFWECPGRYDKFTQREASLRPLNRNLWVTAEGVEPKSVRPRPLM